jgi:hypothetical protein
LAQITAWEKEISGTRRFDAKRKAVVTFWQVVDQRLATAKVRTSSSA